MSTKRRAAADEDGASLSDAAIAIAEGWETLPTDAQWAVKAIINAHVANLCPILRPLYAAAHRADQRRADLISERFSYQFQKGNGTTS